MRVSIHAEVYIEGIENEILATKLIAFFVLKNVMSAILFQHCVSFVQGILEFSESEMFEK